jgi:2,4-dienoyl-CoA reductase (NADPH2)
VECIKSNNSSPVTNLPSIVFRLSSACHETEISIEPDSVPPSERLHIGVVGSGPAGMAFAHTAATIGHLVTIFDKSQEIGGKSEI